VRRSKARFTIPPEGAAPAHRVHRCVSRAGALLHPPARTDEDELEDELPENSSGSTPPEAYKRPILSVFSAGGAEGGRTPDLLIAK
jgi:hypothetical protein